MTPSPRRRTPVPAASRVSRWLLAIAMAGSALAVGTVHTVTLCLVAWVLAAAAFLAWHSPEPLRVRPAATLLLFTGLGLVGYTLLQCLPLPIGWLAVLAPHNADVWSRTLTPLHEPGPSWAPLTLDPPATRIECLRGVVYLLTFLTALQVARRREGVAFLSGAIVTTGVLLAVAALLHPAFGATKLFGLYDPGPGVGEAHIAPLMNPNNLAGYLNLAFCLVLAASLAREPRVPRSIAVAIAIFLGAAQIWVASRGGVIALLLGATAVTALFFSDRMPRRDPRAWVTAGCGVATVVGGILIVVGSSDRAKGELLDPELSKFAVLLEIARMLPAYGIFGVGRGAFESTFPQFRSEPGHTTYTNPEDIVAQWVVEWGVAVGILGLLAIVVALRPTAALARSRTAAGAWAALAAIAAQNMADFSSEIPGVMISVVVCAAIVVAGSAGLAPRWSLERWSRSPARVRWSAAGASLLALVAGVSAIGKHVHEDRRRLHEAAVVRVVPEGEMRDLARAAMLRHPAEPYLPFITAFRAMHEHDDNPLPWLAATLERARVYGPAHLLLARALASRSPSQARFEYRLAFEQAGLGNLIALEAKRLVASFDDAMELVPPGPAGNVMLYWLGHELRDRLPAACVRLDEALALRDPLDPGPVLRAATDAVADLETASGVSWCEGAGRSACVERALALSRKLQNMLPGACLGYGLEARALVAAGRSGEAVQHLEKAVDRVSERVSCLQILAQVAGATQDEPRFEAALGEIARAGCSDPKQCVSNLVWVAQTEEAKGNPRLALANYKKAHDRAPDDDSLLESMARLAGAAGLNAEALKDYQDLARRHPDDVRWSKAVEEQREATLRGANRF